MSVIDFEQHPCNRARAHLDSYLNDELPVETAHEVSRHLEKCFDCSETLAGRRRVKAMLRSAVMKESASPALQQKIRRRMRQDAGHGWPRWTLVAAAVMLIAAGLAGLRVWNHSGSLRPQAVAEVAGAQVLEVGLKDHVHCALDSGFADRAFTEAEMREKLGPEFFGLVALVNEKLPGRYRVTVGHRCKAYGREYVHLILKGQQTALSLVVTRKNGDSFAQPQVAAILESAGVPVYGARLNDLEVAGFETRDYLAFVVSDLSREENLQVASALAPPVQAFLGRLSA